MTLDAFGHDGSSLPLDSTASTSPVLDMREAPISGHMAGSRFGLSGNVITFLRAHGHLAVVEHDRGSRPRYAVEDCKRCRDAIFAGTIKLDGSALTYWNAKHGHNAAPAARPAPVIPEPVGRDARPALKTVRIEDATAFRLALTPLACVPAALAEGGYADLPDSFPLVEIGGAVKLTLGDARKARDVLRGLRTTRG